MTKANINKLKAIWIVICVLALLALNTTVNVMAQVNEDQEELESINEEDVIEEQWDNTRWKDRTNYLLKKYRDIDKELNEELDILIQDVESKEKLLIEEIKKIINQKIKNNTEKLIQPQLDELDDSIKNMGSASIGNKTNVNDNKTSITGLGKKLSKFEAKQLEMEKQLQILGDSQSIINDIQEIKQWKNQQEKLNTSSSPEEPGLMNGDMSPWLIVRYWQLILIGILVICIIALCIIAFSRLFEEPHRSNDKGVYPRSVSRTKTPIGGYSGYVQTYSHQPKEVNESNLISWWNENGAKSYSPCSESLKEEFGNNCSPKFLRTKGSDINEWKLINIRETKSSRLYVLPRKNSPYKDNIAKWFITEEKEVKNNAYISSLIKPAITILNRDESISKGIVKICEIKSRREDKLTDVEKEIDITNWAITEPETKPLTENNLIDWWVKNSAKTYNKCKDIIKEEFGNNISIEAIEYNPNDKEEWYLIGIAENSSSEFYYVLPRKYDYTVSIKNWFEAKEGSTSRDASICSLIKTARMQANITPRTPSEKGEVTLKF